MNKTVYFLSSSQQRSLIAEGWAEKLSVPNWTFKSAGWVDAKDQELSVLAMKELCIDISSFPRTRIEIPDLDQASVIVKIQDSEYDEDISLPSDLEKKVIYWHLPNPRKRSRNQVEEWARYQEICDEIALKVKSLETILPDFN
ncbi:low molecular weight phosphatase family protein [Rossellomorea sp. NS-SX7]|uniref:low molecular weight phosphatase family protein n=1 Tax=Rossellomorea sp. NS-SX7 TaxID=3463856 RepID=UPI0040581498